MKSLSELITEASSLINQISNHPDYRALVDEGYSPDLNIGDACTALVYLTWTVDRESLFSATKISEIEVDNE